MRKYFIPVLFFLTVNVSAQVVDGVLKCRQETFDLLKEISASPSGGGQILLSITTHQDLGWVDEVEKCIIMRDTLWLTPYLDRLRSDPSFRMDIEQTSIIVEYLNRHPERKEEIVKGLNEGRILIGATYTQPYEEMFSGEALVRQLYLGKKWLADNFNGYNSDTYYNSDVPGRTLQMSQILAKAGVKNMFVSRHEKGIYNWFSPDGSKVTMFSSGHYIDFYNILGKAPEEGIAGMAREVLFWDKYYDRSAKQVVIPALLNYEFIWDQKPVKNCDPFISMWNSIRSIENDKGERISVTLPPFRYGNLNNCLNTISATSESIRNISGERPAVWLYIHGPSHHFAISASREADILLPDAEKFSAINAILEDSFLHYDQERFDRAWQAKIYPDHGWGGKGGEITDRLFLSKFVEARDEAAALLSGALERIASRIEMKGTGTPVVVFNGLNWKRSDPVTVKLNFGRNEAGSISLYDVAGKLVPSQVTGAEFYPDHSLRSCSLTFVAADVPSVGYQTFYVRTAATPVTKAESDFNPVYENKFFRVSFGNGGIEKLYDKTLGRDIAETTKFRLGEVFTMQSVGNGAGEFSDIQQPSMEGFDKTGAYDTKWEKSFDGPVFTEFRYRQPVRFAVIEESIVFWKEIKRIDFNIDIRNWQGILYREFRAAFPLKMDSPEITYEVPMGTVTVGKDELKGAAGNNYPTECRLIHPRTMTDWVSMSDDRYGATLSSSVIGFDYLDPVPGPVAGTLLQPILLASRKSCHWEGNDYIQLGDHHFSFSLFTHEPGWKNGAREGKQGQNKLYTVIDPVRSAVADLPGSTSFIKTSGDPLLLTCFKKCGSDDNIILRIVNTGSSEERPELGFFRPLKKVMKTDLIENETSAVGQTGKVLKTVTGAHTIETYKLEFK
jgi:alpha-mannosidase